MLKTLNNAEVERDGLAEVIFLAGTRVKFNCILWLIPLL
ncbi:hypothetical protein DSBG_0563 [Desulfosporosinus sp. BG]|nr:hypothetical protein DSBG_0563 [Desulfosporosinus sp. BG]